MPNYNPKPRPKLVKAELRSHIEKMGFDYELFDKCMSMGLAPHVTRQVLNKKYNYTKAIPHLSTVKRWAGVWLDGSEA